MLALVSLEIRIYKLESLCMSSDANDAIVCIDRLGVLRWIMQKTHDCRRFGRLDEERKAASTLHLVIDTLSSKKSSGRSRASANRGKSD